ncbi:A-kinase anchor protein 13 isoform X2 [Pogona vitticeps]
MKLNPQQAPLYGDSVITIVLTEDDQVGGDDVVFYLVFTGSAVQHCTSTRKRDPLTLETIVPGHDCCETVKVALCASKQDQPVLVVAKDTFQFVQDEAYDAAQFLATCAGNQQALNFTRFLDRSRPPAEDVNYLDEKVTLAFRHLKLPDEWNVLGTDDALNENVPRETLMHFAVRLGLLRLTWFLLHKPGGRGALCVTNSEGATPISLASERGHQKLHQLLTEEEAGEPESWSTLSHTVYSGEYCIKYHQRQNIYTLTAERKKEMTSNMEKAIVCLQTYLRSHPRTDTREQPHLQQVSEGCGSGAEVGGPASALGPSRSEDVGESAPLDLDAIEISVPPCVEEEGSCQPLPELLVTPTNASRPPEDADSAEPSCRSKSTASGHHKEEEEGLASAVGCGAPSEASRRNQRSGAVSDISAGLPPSGNANEEAGMTSPVEPGDPCESSRLPPEAPHAEAGPAESATEPSASSEDGTVEMGQGECKSCTGAVDVAATAHQCVVRGEEEEEEEEEEEVKPPGSKGGEPLSSPGAAPAALAVSLHGEVSAIAACKAPDPGGPERAADLQGDGHRTVSTDLSPAEGEKSQQSGPEAPSAGKKDDLSSYPEDSEPLLKQLPAVAPSSGTERATLNLAGPLEGSPKPDLVGKGDGEGQWKKDAEVGAQVRALDSSDGVRNSPSEDSVEGGRLSQMPITEPSGGCASDNRAESSAGVHDEQTASELAASGTETARGGSVGAAVAPSCSHKQGADVQCRCSEPSPSCAGASEPLPCPLSPGGSSLAEAEAVGRPVETAACQGKLDRFSKSAQEFIAVASALIVEDAIQQAWQALAREDKIGAAPVGQEASPHSEGLVLPSCAKGTQCVQDNETGTPSAVHNKESKQNQEVAAAAAATAEATEQAGATQGKNPAGSERPTERTSLVDHQENPSENGTFSQLPESRREQVGRGAALLEGLPAAAVVQLPAQDPGKECRRDEGNAPAGLEGEAFILAADENRKVGETGDGPPGAGRAEVAPQGAKEALFPDAVVIPGLEPNSSTHIISPPGTVSDFMEAPLISHELPMGATLLREGEEVENVPSRTPLQPIAEEPPCDCDSGSETFLLACEDQAGSEVEAVLLAEPRENNGAGSRAEPERQDLAAGLSSAAELTDETEGEGSVSEVDGILVGPADEGVKNPDRAMLVAEASDPLASLPESRVEITPLTESVPKAHQAADARPVAVGEADLDFQPDGLLEKAADRGPAGSSPVADALEMKTEEEVDASKDPADAATTSEGTINQESWCPVEPSSDPSLLAPKPPCANADGYNFLEDGLPGDTPSSQVILQRGSESESDFFPLSGDGMDEMDFGKAEEEQSAGDSTSSSSSAEDTISLERNSSLGSDTSLPQQAFGLSRPKDRPSLDGGAFNMAAGVGGLDGEEAALGELDEELDRITEVPPPPSTLRNAVRPLSPFRRHSWGPGKNANSESEINHRSSMRLLGDGVKKPPTHRRSLSWCPSGVQCTAMGADFNGRSYSLEGLAGEADSLKKPSSGLEAASLNAPDLQQSPLTNDERGSLVSLTEEELESEQVEARGFDRQRHQRSQPRAFNFCPNPVSSPLTKSMSLMAITQTGPDTQGRTRPPRRISFSFSISPLIPKSKTVFSVGSSSSDDEERLDSNRSFSSTSSSLTQSISEESGSFLPPSPSRKDLEGKSGTKVSRTFSYLKNKMSSSKKSKEKEKDKEKIKEKEKDSKDKEKDKKSINGHFFAATPTVGPVTCYHCLKPFNKDSFACSGCGVLVHKSCRESLPACAKVKMKLQKGGLQPHDTSSLPTVIMRSKTSQAKERPRSAILAPDESTPMTSLFNSRRSQHNPSLSKSVSIQNIAGVGSDESILHTLKFLSQSTDSLNKISRVNESMESLTDEGADMNEGQLMGDFESDSKQLEAQSWSQVVDAKFLRQQKKDTVKRQDVIYELMQTEMHHVRTLKIMSDVYSRGMVQELQYEQPMVEKVFPCLDDLLNIHSQFFQRILERKRESLAERSEKNFVIKRIGDILVSQFSGENAERMKKTYGKFCGHHNEAVNYFKDLHSKEKRFQAFIKKKMSSSVVRRLGIPECILLVTQRITKYPVLLQRILQHTKDNDEEHEDLVLSLNLVKEVITAVNSKVSNYEKKMRLNEIYTRTDSKSIMRMKSGQMFAREDLRRRKFVRDGPVSLRNAAGRLKEVQAVLLSDVLIFLQEKDQKYVFASLDQKSTVISLKKLIVREVAHEEKGLFLISMGGKDPEMVEVHASSKEERNSWIHIIQETINTMDKEEDEGVPSESEEEKRVLDTKARELKEQLHQKDQQIITLLEEKDKLFRDMTDCSGHEEHVGARTLFRANTEDAPKGENVMKSVINEVELLQGLVSQSLGSALEPPMSSLSSEQVGVGPVSLPRRAETFGGFDSHQMNVCKGGEKDEGDEVQDLRRTESDSVLKKGGTANLMFVIKRNNEQVLQSISHLHSLLGMLQAIVVQQDTFIEDQKLLLSERALTRSSFRPNSLIEQEKQRSMEKQRQELANLQRQQAQHQEEKRRREREWEAREKELAEREGQLAQREEQVQKGHQHLEKEREELQQKKAAYQLDLEHLRAAQKQLEKEKEQLKKDMEQISQPLAEPSHSLLHAKMTRTPSLPATEDTSSWPLSSSLPKPGIMEAGLSESPKRNSLSRTHKEKSGFHLMGTTASSQTHKSAEGQGQMPNRLFGLAKPKEKKEKKKKGKGHRPQSAETHSPEVAPEGEEIFC